MKKNTHEKLISFVQPQIILKSFMGKLESYSQLMILFYHLAQDCQIFVFLIADYIVILMREDICESFEKSFPMQKLINDDTNSPAMG